MEVLGAKTSRSRPFKTKIRRGPGGEATVSNAGGSGLRNLENVVQGHLIQREGPQGYLMEI